MDEQKNTAFQNPSNTFLRFIKEIMSVTIGLSLALGIENYSTISKERQLEEYYLTEIRNDLKSDMLKLREIIDYNKKRTYFLDKIAYNKIESDSFLISASYLRTVAIDYENSKPNFEALKSSSYFNIIRNKDLLNNIIEHYDFMKRFQTQKHDLDEHFTHIVIPYLEDNFVLWDFFVMNRPDFEPQSNIEKILTDKKFKNLTLTHTEGVHLQTKILSTYLKLSDELIKKIEQEMIEKF